MSRRVLSVGQCVPDDGSLLQFLSGHFEVELVRCPNKNEALERLHRERFDLILINRKLDADYTDGVDVLKAIQADPDINTTPCMLISNYPEAQEQAALAGAAPGFGKLEYKNPEVVERLRKYLG